MTPLNPAADRSARRPLIDYRAIWRWHFYAGLFCVPFILVLALTGSIYLFKPQVEAWLDRPYDHLALTGPAASPQAQAEAALAAVPGSRLKAYELPRAANAAVRVIVQPKSGGPVRVYVHPQTLQVLKTVREQDRFMQLDKKIHGELLMGENGSILVELAASWAIVMIVTGLYLWWPRAAQGLAGVVWPRWRLGGRIFWRDLHAVTGLWISGLALFLLLTGLPWTHVWGEGLKSVRRLAAPAAAPADWVTAGRPDPSATGGAMGAMDMGGMDMSGMSMAGMDHAAPARPHAGKADLAALDAIVPALQPMGLAYPALISPPGRKAATWTARSDSQNRPLRVEMDVTPDGRILRRQDFGQKPVIDRIVGVGVAAHEGQLFGWLNQALGVVAALGLTTLAVSGVVMWWRRRPDGALGAPPALPEGRMAIGLGVLILAFAVFLPVLGVSLVLVALVERLVLKRIPAVRIWLGLAEAPGRAGATIVSQP